MSDINNELQAIDNIATGVQTNKVANFSYTATAYTTNDVTGVEEYAFSNNQNIPAATTTATDLNQVVLDKGIRTQAASLPRNAINHFFGRVSYNLNKVVDLFRSTIASLVRSEAQNGCLYSATANYKEDDVCFILVEENGNKVTQYYRRISSSPVDLTGVTPPNVLHWQRTNITSVTPSVIDNTTNIATTAFVKNQVPSYDVRYGILEYLIPNTKFGLEAIRSVIQFASGRVLAVGHAGKAAYSDDNGLTWTLVSNTKFGGAIIYSVIQLSSGRVLAVGSSGKVAYSDDNGITWTLVADTKFGLEAIRSVIQFASGRVFAVGGSGKAAYSDNDGVTWTLVSDTKFGLEIIYSVIQLSSARVLAVGESGKAAYSDDNGLTWTLVADTKFGVYAIFSVIQLSSGRVFAVGGSGKAAYSDDDGLTWTLVADAKFGSSVISSVTQLSSGRVLAVGESGKAAYSDDNGLTWTLVADTKFGLSTIVSVIQLSSSIILAVGSSGYAVLYTKGLVLEDNTLNHIPIYIIAKYTNPSDSKQEITEYSDGSVEINGWDFKQGSVATTINQEVLLPFTPDLNKPFNSGGTYIGRKTTAPSYNSDVDYAQPQDCPSNIFALSRGTSSFKVFGYNSANFTTQYYLWNYQLRYYKA